MPRTARATDSPFLRLHAPDEEATSFVNDSRASGLAGDLLPSLQRQMLQYFIDNHLPTGLVLDRQSNHGPRRLHGLCSTAATGMGLIALALAAASPYRLLSPREARRRVRVTLRVALEQLPSERGLFPHFLDATTGAVVGDDHFSTVDSAWLIAGALWAAEFLQDDSLGALADRLYERVDWRHWTGGHPTGLLRHGKDRHGRFLPCAWDRLNGETVFLYVLAAGAEEARAIDPDVRAAWRHQPGTVAGHTFNHADLGLFVFQYGMDLLDLSHWRAPGGIDLHADAQTAALANRDCCREQAQAFMTYRRFWGLSAGDGPGPAPLPDAYRAFSPAGPIDGTAHLTAALASIAHCPEAVLENLREAADDPTLGARGRYGFSNINLDCGWIGPDMVGIDAGAAVLALDNFLIGNRVRRIFHRLAPVDRGLRRLGFARRVPARRAS